MEQRGAVLKSPEDEMPEGEEGKRVKPVQENVELTSEIFGSAGEGDSSIDCGLRRRFVSVPGETLDRPITSSMDSSLSPEEIDSLEWNHVEGVVAMESTSDDSFKGYHDRRSGNEENKQLGSVSRRILEPEMPSRDQPPKLKKRKKKRDRKSTTGTLGRSVKSADSDKHGKGKNYIIRNLWKTGDEFRISQVDSYPLFVMGDFVVYLIFMTVVCIIVFGSRGPAHNYYSDVLRKLITNSLYNSSLGPEVTFRDMQNHLDMWTFIIDILCKVLYDKTFVVQRQKITNPGLRVLTENMFFGAPQLRQLRVRGKTCTSAPLFQSLYGNCVDYYSEELEDKGEFGPKTLAWRYVPPPEDHSYFTGEVSTYPEGGFVMNFTTDESFTLDYIAQLRDESWIRFGTRAVFIDFVLFNPNTHLLCACKLIFEFPPSGGILPSYRFSTLKLLRYVEPWDFFILSCEMLFIGFSLYYAFEELLQIIRLREAYLSNWWNFLDITIIICSYFAIACGVLSAIKTVSFVKRNVDKIHTSNHVSFDKIVDIQSRFHVSMAMVVFFVWMKIFKFSTLNRTASLILGAIKRAAPTLLVVTIMVLTIMTGFAIFGFVMFGPLIYSFRTVGHSIFTTFRLVTGGIHWHEDLGRHGTNNSWMLWYCIFFLLFVRVIFLNIYVALVVDAFEEEVKESNELSNTATIGDVFREVFRKYLIFFGQDRIALRIDEREVIKQNMRIYDAVVVILRRHGYEGMEADLILEKHQITYGFPILKETMSALYDDINVRNQLSLEVEDHNKLKEQIEQMDKTILVMDQTLMGLMTKVDILTDRYIQKRGTTSSAST